VIVPGFGGFITHHVDAHYDENDRLWLPPYRTLGFNPQLTLNDSLLVQSYVEAYDMSYPDALRQVEAEIEELKSILHTEGKYEMDGVGTLRVNIEGNVEFEPCEAGILTPDLYGLSSFEMNQIADITAKVKEQEMAHEASGNSNHQDQAITIKMSWVRNTVAVAAALLAFFMMTTPVVNSEQTDVSMSQVNLPLISKDSNQKKQNVLDEQTLKQALPQRDTTATQTEAVEEQQQEPEIAQKQEQEQEQEPKSDFATSKAAVCPEQTRSLDVAKPQPYYCIVLASQVTQTNAEEFVEKLKHQGINARVYLNNNIRRVICGKYATHDEAHQHLQDIRSRESLADAWVYQVNP
jgi:cell division septation protein DedD